ncbi:Sentrin-specific protease 6 [Gaertneriomyces sp. JEL0708]|nr:Sentrin-specific protease 6 [Gaertneriomyces sp. JEL0708]
MTRFGVDPPGGSSSNGQEGSRHSHSSPQSRYIEIPITSPERGARSSKSNTPAPRARNHGAPKQPFVFGSSSATPKRKSRMGVTSETVLENVSSSSPLPFIKRLTQSRPTKPSNPSHELHARSNPKRRRLTPHASTDIVDLVEDDVQDITDEVTLANSSSHAFETLRPVASTAERPSPSSASNATTSSPRAPNQPLTLASVVAQAPQATVTKVPSGSRKLNPILTLPHDDWAMYHNPFISNFGSTPTSGVITPQKHVLKNPMESLNHVNATGRKTVWRMKTKDGSTQRREPAPLGVVGGISPSSPTLSATSASSLEQNRESRKKPGEFPTLPLRKLLRNEDILFDGEPGADRVELKVHAKIIFLVNNTKVIELQWEDVMSFEHYCKDVNDTDDAVLTIRDNYGSYDCLARVKELKSFIEKMRQTQSGRRISLASDAAGEIMLSRVHSAITQPRSKRRREEERASPGPRRSKTKPNKGAGTHELFRYPLEGKSAVTVRQEDYDRLDEGQFLNDVIIEFYLKYVIQEIMDPALRDRVHIFNSFFYERLTQKDANTPTGEKIAYANVKKWTRNVDLFSKEFVFVPVCENMHWYLAFIYNPGALVNPPLKTIDSEDDESPDQMPEVATISLSDTVAAQCSEPMEISEATQAESAYSAYEGDDLRTQASDQEDDVQIHETSLDTDLNVVTVDDGVEEWTPEPSPTDMESKTGHKRRRLKSKRQIEFEKEYERDEEEKRQKIALEKKLAQESKKKIALQKKLEDDIAKQQQTTRIKSSQYVTSIASPLLSVFNFLVPWFRCSIIILDSLHSPHSNTIMKLKHYLAAEAYAKRNVTVDLKDIQGINAKAPGQDNFSDCGVYLCYYVESLLKRPEPLLHLIFNRLRRDDDWFARHEIMGKRQEMRELLDNLRERWSQMHDPTNPQIAPDATKKIEPQKNDLSLPSNRSSAKMEKTQYEKSSDVRPVIGTREHSPVDSVPDDSDASKSFFVNAGDAVADLDAFYEKSAAQA